MKKNNVKIQDIAEELGLSRNTVSKALNGQYVSNKNKTIILKKAQEMNYKSMKDLTVQDKKVYHILLLSGKPLSNIDYFFSIIRGIENYCFERQIQLFQYTFNGTSSSFIEIKNFIDNFNIDGIVCVESFKEDFIKNLLRINIPICFIDFAVLSKECVGDYDIILPENQYNLLSLMSELIRKHDIKNISFVGDYKHCLSFYERYTSTLMAIKFNNLEHSINEDILESDIFDYGDSNKLKFKIIENSLKSQLYVCSNDFIARATINALKSLGKQVPNDAMVIGFDDSNESKSNMPSITTIGVDKVALGKLSVITLLNRINNPNCPSTTIRVSTPLFKRESTNKIS